jgi:tetratricopeptide (TPR) repeat protein
MRLRNHIESRAGLGANLMSFGNAQSLIDLIAWVSVWKHRRKYKFPAHFRCPVGSRVALFCIVFSCALVAFSQPSPQSAEQEVESHWQMAQQYQRESRTDLAIVEYKAMIALDPKNVNARANLGVLLFFQGDYVTAAPNLRAALLLQHDLWKIEALLGICDRKIGGKDSWRNELEEAFPHLQDDKFKYEVGDELIAGYSSSGDLGKAKSIKNALAKIGQTALANEESNSARSSGTSSSVVTRTGLVGDSSCLGCHKDESASYAQTSHHLTSFQTGTHPLPGSFRMGSNVLVIHDAKTAIGQTGLLFRMDEKDLKAYETAVMGRAPHVETETESMDLVIGSGKRGQSYLYWDGDALYQLPISYWSDGGKWINSPGYTDGTADFTRPIDPRCMECHSTFIRPLTEGPKVNRYDRDSVVPGISCETCHGPGAEHASEMQTRLRLPSTNRPNKILNPAKFPRERQVDLCALCHNGTTSQEITPAFSYLPGEPLEEHVAVGHSPQPEHVSVHGNQVGLLERSRCYQASGSMTCSTCHNVHAPERPVAFYSAQCLTCHERKNCGLLAKLASSTTKNCIDCHMPVEPATAVMPVTAGKSVHAAMHNHWIKVHPELSAP